MQSTDDAYLLFTSFMLKETKIRGRTRQGKARQNKRLMTWCCQQERGWADEALDAFVIFLKGCTSKVIHGASALPRI